MDIYEKQIHDQDFKHNITQYFIISGISFFLFLVALVCGFFSFKLGVAIGGCAFLTLGYLLAYQLQDILEKLWEIERGISKEK